MSRLAVAILGSVLALVATGVASASTEDEAKRVAVALTWANINAQYGKAWTMLHPRYQLVTTRAFWESCQRKETRKRVGIEWLSVKALDAYADRVELPLLGRTSVTAVTMQARFDYLGLKRTITDTVYWTKLKVGWRSLWKPETYRAYKAHRCPS